MAPPEDPRPSRNGRWRNIPRILAKVALGVVLLLGLVVVGLHTPPARRYVLTQVQHLVSQQQIDLQADQLDYRLLDLAVDLRSIRVRSPEALAAPPFATIDRLRVDLSLMQLLRGRYVVESADVEGVAVHYAVDASGADNLPRPPEGEPGEPIDYLVERLRADTVTVRYENRQQDVEVTWPALRLAVDGHALSGRHTVTIAATRVGARMQAQSAMVDRVTAVLDLGDADVTVEQFEVAGEGAELSASGDITNFADPRGNLTVRATADVARAASLAQVADPVRGRVTLTADIRGSLSTPAVDVTVDGAALGFRDIDGLDISGAGRYDLGTRAGTIERLQAQAPWGQVAATGTVVEDVAGTSAVKATITGLDVATLMRGLDLGMVAATRVDGQVNLSWPGLDVQRSSGDAVATLSPTRGRVETASVPVGGHLSLTGRDGAMTVTVRALTAAATTTSGQVAIDAERRLRGTLRTHTADVTGVVAAAESWLGRPSGSLLPTPAHGRVSIDTRLAGSLDTPLTSATIAAPALSVGEVTGIAVQGGVRYSPERVEVAGIDVTWREAAINAVGTVGLTGRQPIDLRVTGTAIDVASVLAALDMQDTPVAGRVSFDAAVSGTVVEPAALATLGVDGLEASGEVLGQLTARATLAGQLLTVPDLRLDKPQPGGDGEITGTATYLLDTTAYTLDLRSSNVRLLTATLPDGRPVRGVVDVRAGGTGVLDALQGNAVVSVADLTVAGMALGTVSLDATVADARATVRATAESFRVALDGVVGIDSPYPATATARIDGLDLATLPIELDSRLEGTVRATAEFTGDALTPALGRGALTIDAFEGRWNDQPFAVTTARPIRVANERLTIDGLAITAQDSRAEIGGELPITADGADGQVTIEARANLAALAAYAPADAAVSADGLLTIAGSVRGSLEAIDPDLTIAIEDGLVIGPALEPGVSGVQLRTRIADGVAAIEQLTAAWGSARLDGAGRVPLNVLPELPVALPRQDGPAEFSATVRGFDLAALPGAPPGLSGRVSLDAQVSAERAELGALEGRITFPELALAFDGLTLSHQAPTVISIAGGTATIEPTTLTGSAGTVSASGRVGLTGSQDLDVAVKGAFEMGAIATFADGVTAEGTVNLDVAARGTVAAPDVAGQVTVDDGRVALDEPRVAAENLTARIDLSGTRLDVTALTAEVNGGALTASGGLSVANGEIADADVRLTATDFAFDAPLDLRSLSAADLRLARRGDEFVVDGTVTIEEAGLTGDINFDTGLLASITAPRTLDLTEERNPLVERVRLDVQVKSRTPIVVDNNLARAEARLDVRVVGTPYEPGLSGQMNIDAGGEIVLNERRYSVDRGTISFIDDRRIQPSFDLELGTSVRNYDITLRVTGPPGDTETSLTSDPALPEPDIMAMLVTGRGLDEMRGEEYDVAREQVLSYLTGRVGSSLGRGLQNATGLTNVRIEPNLIATEADPSARLTLGQALTDDLHLVYSTSLTDSSDQIWQAQYDLTRRFQTQTTRQSDNTYRFDVRHDLRFGGAPEPRRLQRTRPTVTGLEFTGDQPLPEAEMRRIVDVEVGKPLDYFAVRDGVQDLEEALRRNDLLQARVRVTREVTGDAASLRVAVNAGPPVDLRIVGAEVPRKVVDEVRTKWHRGVFDAQRTDDGAETLRDWLMRERYLQPVVTSTLDDQAGRRQVTFQVTPGPRSERVVLVFEGAAGVAPKVLDDIVDDQNLEQDLFTDPLVVTELLQRFYREQGYLTAAIDLPRYEFEGPVARVVLTVREGPRYAIRRINAAGNQVLATTLLFDRLPLEVGDPFLPFAAENAIRHLRDLYWQRGYNDATAEYALALDDDSGEVDVTFTVREGRQSVVADVVVTGVDRTSERLVREQLAVRPSEPLDLAALSRARRALYDTGAYSVAEVVRQPLTGGEASAAGDAPASPAGVATQPVRIEVNVREVQPFQLRYGVTFDNERGLGGIADVSNHNSLGKARVVGLRTRYDAQLSEGRLYMSQPSLRYLPVQLTASIYYREERNPQTELTEPFNVDRHGIAVQGETTLRNAYVWNYGYRYERSRSSNPADLTPEQFQTVAPLTSTFTREQRDDILDASRGSFTAHSLSYSPAWLGSSQSYVKYLGQYFHYIPLRAPTRKRFTNEILRPRLVFATGVRVGVARGIGGAVPISERFFAGGSTTLRGFAQNAVGPIGIDNLPEGGEGMFVLNAELRAPLVSIVDGVVFTDVGNVYSRLQDVSVTDLRTASGLGLRVRTPWFLLRADYGLVINPRQGERRGRFFFSLGQAF